MKDLNTVYLAFKKAPTLFESGLRWRFANMRFLFIAGDYYSGPPGDLDQEPDEDWVRSRQNEGRAYQEWDEDADVDESGEVLPELDFKPLKVKSVSLSPDRFCPPQVAIVLSPGTFLGWLQGGA